MTFKRRRPSRARNRALPSARQPKVDAVSRAGNASDTSDDKRHREHSRSQKSVGSGHACERVLNVVSGDVCSYHAPCSTAACRGRWPIRRPLLRAIHQSANERLGARSRHATVATGRRQILVHAEQVQRVVALRPSVETTWTRTRPLTWRFQPHRAMLKPDGGEMRSALMCRLLHAQMHAPALHFGVQGWSAESVAELRSFGLDVRIAR